MIRNRAFIVSCIGVPLLLFASVGTIVPRFGGRIAIVTALASFCSYTVINTSMYSFGAIVAFERGQRMTLLMRSTPLRPMVYFTSKLIAANCIVVASVVSLLIYGATAYHISLSFYSWILLTVCAMLGTIPFVALGLGVGYNFPPHATSAIMSVVVLPISLASGVLVPVSLMSRPVQIAAWFTPSYHFTQLLWAAGGVPSESVLVSCIWLGIFSIPLFYFAAAGYKREEKQNYG